MRYVGDTVLFCGFFNVSFKTSFDIEYYFKHVLVIIVGISTLYESERYNKINMICTKMYRL